MADPRTYTVKQCEPAYAAKSGASIASATSARRDFFNSVGKIGDIAALKDVGGGKIGSGLRTLASISNSIRTGCGALPTSIGQTIDSGANWVLEQTGIAPTVVDALKGFHPGIANQAYSQAKNIYTQVKKGKFKTRDIPNVIQDLQNLERLGRNIFTPSGSDGQTALGEHCEASPYAVDLIARAPKYKFLFVVQFVPEAGYSPLGGQAYGPLDMAFVVKRSTRPNLRYQSEDVNYYNFRTKVITRTEFEEMTMSFHDDTMNFGTQFYKSYMQAMTPITNLETVDSNLMESSGMNFGATQTYNQILDQIPADVGAASHGTLADDAKQIFKEIVLYHLFDNGNRMNVYRFFNPRINQLQLDDLDMSVGTEGSEISMSFVYDSVFIDPDVSVADNGGKYNLAQTQRGAVYPLRSNADGTNVPLAGIDPYGSVATSGSGGCDATNPLNTASPGIAGIANAATSAVSNLSNKFSSALSSFSLF